MFTRDDNGSQRSYVTQSLKARLKLAQIRQERLSLNTFGKGRFKRQSCDVVQLRLCKLGSNEGITIEALSFPTIRSSLPSRVDLSKKLDLADFSKSSSHDVIDVLVGSDYYWSIVTGKNCKDRDRFDCHEQQDGVYI